MRNFGRILITAFLLSFVERAWSQNDTTAVDLLGELNAQQEEVPLLPNSMLITQRILWGQHGAMRSFKKFELTPENRQNELKLRRAMFIAHQVMGFATLGGMIGQGIVGSRLYDGNYDVKDLHEGLAVAVNAGYFTTAGLSLFSPPKAVDERKGYSSIKAHKLLAVLHMSGMILTNVLADKASDPDFKPYHRAAAFTAFGAYAASILVIKF
ncbi:MAG: hypothetical protein ACO3FI_06570 [Cyclobacteriaceae bacterium]